MSRSGNSIISYGLRYAMLEFVNDVRLIKHRFTSYCIFSFLTDFSSLFGLWPAVCAAAHSYNAAANRRSICGRLRARANWIRPKPDSVLKSVRSLKGTLQICINGANFVWIMQGICPLYTKNISKIPNFFTVFRTINHTAAPTQTDASITGTISSAG